MLCFDIRINDEPSLVAGVKDISVLSAITTYVANRNELTLEVGGLISKGDKDNLSLDWLCRALQVGDQVSLKVVESSSPTPPAKRHRLDPDLAEKSRRRYYDQLKNQYEGTDEE